MKTKKNNNNNNYYIYMIGFQCSRYDAGCECCLDISEECKDLHQDTYGFPYDDYCHYETIISKNNEDALMQAKDILTIYGFDVTIDESMISGFEIVHKSEIKQK